MLHTLCLFDCESNAEPFVDSAGSSTDLTTKTENRKPCGGHVCVRAGRASEAEVARTEIREISHAGFVRSQSFEHGSQTSGTQRQLRL